MKACLLFLIGLGGFALSPAQTIPEQKSPEVLQLPTGEKLFTWYGHAGRSYFIEVSDPTAHLDKWFWAPVIESGADATISYEVDGTADKGFYRIHHTDQVPGPGLTLDTADFDNDGLTNWDEITVYHTHPLKADTDGDSLPDGWEIANGLDPLHDGSVNFVNGANGDKDGDGRNNIREFLGGSSGNDPDDYPVSTTWVERSVRQQHHTLGEFGSPVGWKSFGNTWNNGHSYIEHPPLALTPATMLSELAATMPFPAQPGSSAQERDIYDSFAMPSADFTRFANPNGGTGVYSSLVQPLIVLKIPPNKAVPVSRTISFLLSSTYLEFGYTAAQGMISPPEGYPDPIPFHQEIIEFEFLAGALESVPKEIPLQLKAGGTNTHTISDHTFTTVSIKPAQGMAGVVGDSVPSVLPSSKIAHFVSPKKTTQVAQDHVILQVKGIEPEHITPGHAKQVLEWDSAVGEAVPDEPTKWRVSRAESGRFSIKVKLKDGGDTACEMLVWIVWCETTVTPGVAAFEILNDGSQYKISDDLAEKWKFVFEIQPQNILDQNTLERPALSGPSVRETPGFEKLYVTDPGAGSGDTATLKWDVSRQVKKIVRNPDGIPEGWIAKSAAFPALDYEGNDDPAGDDEDANPYAAKVGGALDHAFGELSSFDAPNNPVQNGWHPPGNSYAVESNFREFTRLEIWDTNRANGQFWFRISDFLEWHHYLGTENIGVENMWTDNESSSGLGHPKP